jgi:hypothetical protein
VRCNGLGLALPAARLVRLSRGGQTLVEFRFGRLNVGDLLPWATVLVDGRKVDRTPVSLRVPVGRHQVKLLAADGRESTRQVVVPPDRPVFIDRW